MRSPSGFLAQAGFVTTSPGAARVAGAAIKTARAAPIAKTRFIASAQLK